jgi:SAM-dependent MidA family methyltransferase
VTALPFILDRIRQAGPITVAEYMELALYHPEAGYYARVARRSGRRGDFFTSVDVGPVFGELLSVQVAEMWHLLGEPRDGFDLVEAGAGDGRLSRDVLDHLAEREPSCYKASTLRLVERSPAARADQVRTLGPHAAVLASSGEELPDGVSGVIFANELLDALPVHLIVMREDGLFEVFVDAEGSQLVERERALSAPCLHEGIEWIGARLEPGWRAEINLAALDWTRAAADALSRGFLLVLDYGHEAVELYSSAHPAGSLRAIKGHTFAGASLDGHHGPTWLQEPGDRDITSDVDLTAVRRAAEQHGLETLCVLDQSYFLLGLGAADLLAQSSGARLTDVRRRMALKTLVLPGGLGSTHKALAFGKDVGRPSLRGCSYRASVT